MATIIALRLMHVLEEAIDISALLLRARATYQRTAFNYSKPICTDSHQILYMCTNQILSSLGGLPK